MTPAQYKAHHTTFLKWFDTPEKMEFLLTVRDRQKDKEKYSIVNHREANSGYPDSDAALKKLAERVVREGGFVSTKTGRKRHLSVSEKLLLELQTYQDLLFESGIRKINSDLKF